jgi:GTP cyclohydrolase II
MELLDAWLAEGEAFSLKNRRPLVGLCYAQSLDGSLAGRGGQPIKISGPESLVLTHRLRAMQDAILVGIGTVLADDPSLTVRFVVGEHPQPVVLDSRLRFPIEAKMLSANPNRPWLITRPPVSRERLSALEAAGCEVWQVLLGTEAGVDLKELLKRLAERGIRRLMVEGGVRVITSFLNAGLVDWVCVTLGLRFIGGVPVIDSMRAGFQPLELDDVRYEAYGKDLVVFGRLPQAK